MNSLPFRRIAALLLFAATITSFSQAQTTGPKIEKFPQSWHSVDSLIQSGLTQSALDTVERMYKAATAASIPGQLVKSIIYRMRLTAEKQENPLVKNMERLRVEIKGAAFPVTPLLHSMLGECYLHYYQNNRWRFVNRSSAVNVDQSDVQTWDLAFIMEKAVAELDLSLKDAMALKKVRIDLCDQVIVNGGGDTVLRPTLYDFLAHRAIDFFSMDDIELPAPSAAVILNDKRYFDSFETFIARRFPAEDTGSTKVRALRILRDLIEFHSNDIEALIDADLERLAFVRDHSSLPGRDSLYLKALQTLEKVAPYSPSSADVTFKIASLYNDWAGAFVSRRDEQYRWMNREALAACERAVKAFPESFGARRCAALAGRIKVRSASFTNEYATLPGKPFTALLSYGNLSRVYWRLVPITIDDYQNLTENGNSDSAAVKLAIRKPIKEWASEVPDPGDFQRHSVEIEMPAMPMGHYAILCAVDSEFPHEKGSVVFGSIQVSRLSSVERECSNGDREFHIVDRETGAPVKGVKASLWTRTYSEKFGTYHKTLQEKYTTDKDGHFTAGVGKNKHSYKYLELENHGDRLVPGEPFYLFRSGKPQKNKSLRTFFFTDRSLYRPGQTVYFKAIVLRTDGENSEPAEKEKTVVKFLDANSQQVDQLSLMTNPYGSVHGSFIAPRHTLNGQMRITDERGIAYLSVEDYKRPRFQVQIDTVRGACRLGDTINFCGHARAYTGAPVTAAQVKYRVVRSRKPSEDLWNRRIVSGSATIEIANGATTVSDSGGFAIVFPANADPAVPLEEDPVFTFSVFADVTDMTGETRFASGTVNVGRAALYLSIPVPSLIDKDRAGSDSFSIATANCSGAFEPAKGTIVVYRLKAPEKSLRQRLWNTPDTTVMTRQRHAAVFPLDQYERELDMECWPKADSVFQAGFDTRQSRDLVIPALKTWKSGAYFLEGLSIDRFGRPIKVERYFTVFSRGDSKLPYAMADWFAQITDKCEPGEKAAVLVGSGFGKTSVLYEIEHKGEIIHSQWLPLSNSQERIEFPVEERFRGNFSMNFTFVANNRSYRHTALITVPWTNKELGISFETFRSKLLPGEKEQWRLKITGKNKDKVAAEMVAALYDASLEAFKPHRWDFGIWPSHYSMREWDITQGFGVVEAGGGEPELDGQPPFRLYPSLNWFGFNFEGNLHGGSTFNVEPMDAPAAPAPVGFRQAPPKQSISVKQCVPVGSNREVAGYSENQRPVDLGKVSVRLNLNETAFFLPGLTTDENGEVIVKFQIPEALTRWKMLGFAHTRDLRFGLIDNELVTQKDLMVVPNPPRFFRENDRTIFSAKISNLSAKDLTGSAQLQLFDAATMRPVDTLFKNTNSRLDFKVGKGGSAPLAWELSIPEGIGAVQFKVVAKAGDFSDGEEQVVPVLGNRMLVIESVPLSIRNTETKKFTFNKLISQNDGSTTLRNHRLTLEFVSNPVWYAVQALPYIMEYPYECAEQTFGRLWANTIATYITNSSPHIKAILDLWRSGSPDALLSNLEKNQELKSLMLEETPWLFDGKSESEQKKRIALLFDINKMADEKARALNKLKKQQSASGAWPWFEGMPDDRFITQYIAIGIGRLIHLGMVDPKKDAELADMARRAVLFCDERAREDYENLLRSCPSGIAENHIFETQVQYLYLRSYFVNVKMEGRNKKAFEYFSAQVKKFWPQMRRYTQGMSALALARMGEKTIPGKIIQSLKENALVSEEMGMYWKEMYEHASWWYEAPIEAQALMIEAFSEIANDTASVADLKTWLLKSKQTQNWPTTKSTAEAIYGLLIRGKSMIDKQPFVKITLGEATIDPAQSKDISTEAGTGYIKTMWTAADIRPEMGNIAVTKQEPGVGWGAVYWQYFEQLDKIKQHDDRLRAIKKLFLRQNGTAGPKLSPIEGKTLKVGDNITVRIELRVDRDMEYVHLKDMRASGFEPINVFSGCRRQDGLGYYESTRDAATNFFFSYLKKGVYVFEYPLVAAHAGDFSNGITTVQCMYAPEFTSHSEGVRVRVEK
jgi:hypothetical protein